eukprot:snap_masked-scaffold120_size336265-processed-gene-2.2 protein:Tk08791 transcript:snap_masked-scaffold120_size336265-processed-gene-2.2-mRNA-1 annotation:"centrosomal protein of 97 kda"
MASSLVLPLPRFDEFHVRRRGVPQYTDNFLYCLFVFTRKRAVHIIMEELRKKVVARILAGDKLVDVAKRFDIHIQTVHSIRKLYKETGGYSKRPSTGRPRQHSNVASLKSAVEQEWDSISRSYVHQGHLLQVQVQGGENLSDYPFDTTIEQLDKIPTKFSIQEASGLPKCSKNERSRLLLHSSSSVAFLIDRAAEHSALFHTESATFHEEFCVERMIDDEKAVLGIGAIICQKLPSYECRVRPCVRKCCPFGQILNDTLGICQPETSRNSRVPVWEPTLMDNKEEPISGPIHDIKYFYGGISCPNHHVQAYNSRHNDFHFYETGELVINGDRINYTQYCVANILAQDGRTMYEQVQVCLRPLPASEASRVEVMAMDLLPFLFLVSLFFLALTFILVFKRKRDKLFGIMTLCMIGMLFLLYSFLVIPHFTGPSHVTEYPVLCQLEGIAIQFCYLSALFWLNCMCFMIWKNFRRIRRNTENEPKGIRNPLFYKYALWAWGGPALLSTITLIIHLLPDEVAQFLVKPELGVNRCFLGDRGMFLYFHIVTAPCLIFNLLGFVCTSWNLCCGVWSQRQGDPIIKAQQHTRMLTVTKMFFALGISWMSEVISWSLLTLFGREAWVITASFLFDVINALQGAILFVILFFDVSTVTRMRSSIRRNMTGPNEPVLKAKYRIRRDSLVSLTNVTTHSLPKGPANGKFGSKQPLTSMIATLSYPMRKSYTYEITPAYYGSPSKMAVELHLAHGSPPQSLQLVPVPDENEEEDPDILDLGGQNLEKLSRAAPEWQLNTTTLILDDNLLQRLDNIHTYQCLEKLSVQNNQLIRMFQVAKLSHLKILNLANNHVVTMEGLKELKLLTWLSLAANNVKSIENLSQNVHLEHLDLSDNAITTITDVSYLKNIKSLLLHKNRIGGLLGCERYLPTGLTTLTLSDNLVEDLTDVSHLSTLQSLEQLTFANNPAIEQPEDIRKQFDYRPYIINWCLGIQVLDGILVGAKESLKAEWMYSQSKGRQFTNGYHSDLLDYLVETCPLHPDKDWQEDKKLNLILSKVQEHQSSLRNDSELKPLICSKEAITLLGDLRGPIRVECLRSKVVLPNSSGSSSQERRIQLVVSNTVSTSPLMGSSKTSSG